MGSSFIHLIRTDSNVFFLMAEQYSIVYMEYIQLSYPFICWWASRLLPCPGYYKLCCNEHWGTRVSQCVCPGVGLLGHMDHIFLCTDHWGRLSYLSWLFFGTLHSNGTIFPFLLCFSLLFFSQLFVRPPQRTILLFCISFPWGWSWPLSPGQCHKPLSIVHQALCLSDLVL